MTPPRPVLRRLGLDLTRHELAIESPAEMVAAARTRPPSAGTIGLMELREAWKSLPPDKRRLLVLMARGMLQGERGG